MMPMQNSTPETAVSESLVSNIARIKDYAISVVIPTCDRPDRVLKAFATVRAQTHPAHEVLVVDNGNEALDPSKLPSDLKVIRTAPRIGASRARNVGAQNSQGDYIAFLDDDDEWDHNYLRKIHERITSAPSLPGCLLGRRDTVLKGLRTPGPHFHDIADMMPDLLFRNPSIGGSSTVVAREKFVEIGGFDESLITSEDRAIVIEFLLRSQPVLCVPDAVTLIFHHEGPRLTDVEHMLKGKRAFHKKYRHLMGSYEKLRYAALMLVLLGRRYRNIRLLPLSISILLDKLAKCFPRDGWKKKWY